MERALRHMAWANQRVFSAVAELPFSALGSYVVNPEWIAGRIMYHVVDGANFYVHCLGLRPWQPLAIPESMDDMRTLAQTLADLDARILGAAALEDAMLEFADEDGTRRALRSTLLVQAVHHATEHRAQLLDALEARDFTPIALDDIDLWAFERFEQA